MITQTWSTEVIPWCWCDFLLSANLNVLHPKMQKVSKALFLRHFTDKPHKQSRFGRKGRSATMSASFLRFIVSPKCGCWFKAAFELQYFIHAGEMKGGCPNHLHLQHSCHNTSTLTLHSLRILLYSGNAHCRKYKKPLAVELCNVQLFCWRESCA